MSIALPRSVVGVVSTLVAAVALTGCSRDEAPTQAADGETRTVEHVLGSTEVPVAPERVVVTMTALLDSALAVGVTPVASPISFSGFPTYLGSDGSDVESLGESDSGIDIEAVGEADPDLILMNIGYDESVDDTEYEALSQIAPTVAIVTGEQDPPKVAEQVAEALNRADEMAEVAAAYEERAAALADTLADVPDAQLSVSQLRFTPDNVRVMMAETNAGRAMDAVGLTFAEPIPGAEVGEGGYYETSFELLPEATGDVAFVYSTEEGVVDTVESMPVWQEVGAVRAGRVVDVDFEAWMRGQGYLALGAVLDDIAAAYGVTG